MLTKTRGIVIRYVKFRETSIIVQIFTEDHGLMGFVVNGIRSPRSKKSIAYFQPFALLDLVAYIRPGREVQRLSEYRYAAPVHQIGQDVRKSTIILFLSEVMGKLLLHEPAQVHRGLFDFLADAVTTLDRMTSQVENFHLHFLLKAMPHLGLGVSDGESLVHSMELEMIEENRQVIDLISAILQREVTDPVPATGQLRYQTLELILQYYQHHTHDFGQIRSLEVLHQIFA